MGKKIICLFLNLTRVTGDKCASFPDVFIPSPLKIIPISAIIILLFLSDYKIATLNKAFRVLNCIYHLTILIPADNNRVMNMRSECFS